MYEYPYVYGCIVWVVCVMWKSKAYAGNISQSFSTLLSLKQSPIRLFFPSQLPWGSLISAFEARITGGSPHPHSIHMGAWDPAPSLMVYGPHCRSLQLSWLNPLPSILFCGHHMHGMAFLTFFPHYIKTYDWFVCSYHILWLRWIHLLAAIIFCLYVFFMNVYLHVKSCHLQKEHLDYSFSHVGAFDLFFLPNCSG